MSTTDLGSAAINAITPRDLSTEVLHQRQMASFAVRPSEASKPTQHSASLGGLERDFSLEKIPLIGDFFSVLSSLFSSFESGESGAIPPAGPLAVGASKSAPSLAPSLAMTNSGNSALDGRPFDLTRYLSDIDPTPTGSVNLMGEASASVRQASASGERSSQAAIPQITGLATHPANHIPLDMLAQMQARHLEMMAEEN